MRPGVNIDNQRAACEHLKLKVECQFIHFKFFFPITWLFSMQLFMFLLK